jgi:hypothetical protein
VGPREVLDAVVKNSYDLYITIINIIFRNMNLYAVLYYEELDVPLLGPMAF